MEKVILGMSGGVDSSVAAILLKNKGYEVIGITFIFNEKDDTSDAIEVCKKLNIEHHIVEYKDLFKKEVIDKFIDDYAKGLTPNPCVICNKKVKLKLLYDEMIKYNATYIATGHYAKIEDGRLYKSIDELKDQTYFLCEAPKYILDKLLLPLEGVDKNITRQIAREYNLVNSDKKDSTDICFIDSDFKKFLTSKLANKKGDIINIDTNEVIGKHNGIFLYTIGQRKGLGIGGFQDRLFVVGKDLAKKILYVGEGLNDYLSSTSAIIDNVNWISDKRPIKCKAKFRYHQKDNDVTINYIKDDIVEVSYDDIKSVTPGQACVFYLDDECLGGGIIKEVKKNNEKLWYL